MDALSFFNKRFEIPKKESFEIGDEVIDEYGIKAVIVRDPYYIKDEEFTTIFYAHGIFISSTRTKNLTKTGKKYQEVVDLLLKLKED